MATQIKKILSLKGIGRFVDYSPRGNVDWKKLTLIYGENGKGKTTLCSLLRSLASGNAEILRGRKTIGRDIEPDAKILTDTGTLSFSRGTWNGSLDKIRIFDNAFVSENLFDGEQIGTTQKRNLYRVIVGAESVRLATELYGLTRSNIEIQKEITQRSKSIQGFLQGVTLAEFLVYQPDERLKDELGSCERELAAKKVADSIILQPELQIVECPSPAAEVYSILDTTAEHLSADVERSVREHLRLHAMQDGGEEWLVEGLGFDLDEGCPFCGQQLDESALIKAYTQYFGKAYSALKEKVAEYKSRFGSEFSDERVATVLAVLAANEERHNWWKERLVLSPIEAIDQRRVESALSAYRRSFLNLLSKKLGAPLEPHKPDVDDFRCAKDLAEIESVLRHYNSRVTEINQQIRQFKAALASSEQTELEARVARLRCLQSRTDPAIDEQCKVLTGLEETKKSQEQRRGEIKTQLDTTGGEFSVRYRERVNRYLEKFGASFRLGDVNHNYVGGVNARFDIVINNYSVPIGEEDRSIARPNFRNTLSAGDKSTLALVFFLAQLEEEGISDKIVVFDDPFSSQDRFRRMQTQLEILRIVGGAMQTVVLSHDADFVNDIVVSSVGRAETSTLRVSPIGKDTSTIIQCDTAALTRLTWHAQREQLQRFCNEGSASGIRADDAVQKLRPVLEAYCRIICPGLFDGMTMLGSMVSSIEAEGELHPLFGVVEDLKDINQFSRRFHHDDGTTTGPVDETELISFGERVLRIVGAL